MSGALLRFRVMAYIVGVVLVIFTAGIILRYGFGNPHLSESLAPIHGFLYVLYLLAVIDLSFKAKFSLLATLLIALAGTVPFLSFFAEHKVVQDVHRRMAVAAG